MGVLDYERLGDILREQRLDQGLTQTGMATEFKRRGIDKLSQGTLSQLERHHEQLTDFPVQHRFYLLEALRFTEEQMGILNERFNLELEFVLPNAKAASPMEQTAFVRVRVVGKLEKEPAYVLRRTLKERSAETTALFIPPGSSLADTNVIRALREGIHPLLDTGITPEAGQLAVYELEDGTYATIVKRPDGKPIPVESIDGNDVRLLKPQDLQKPVGVVWHAEVPADGLLRLLGS